MGEIAAQENAVLNAQYELEKTNELFYRYAQAWADGRGLKNAKHFFAKQAKGELKDAKFVLKYLLDRGGTLGPVSISCSPIADGATVVEVLESALEQEEATTEALEWMFIQSQTMPVLHTWVVNNHGLLLHQVKEESKLTDILQGTKGLDEFFVDVYIGEHY